MSLVIEALDNNIARIIRDRWCIYQWIPLDLVEYLIIQLIDIFSQMIAATSKNADTE